MTNDATNSLQTSYNLLNLPVQTKSGTTVKANYKYLSDGTKASVLNASGAGYDYNGTFTYSHASGGARTLESVAFGTRQQNGLTTLSANRWRFSGKEGYDSAFGIALDDFGARRYDRTAWTSIDPLAEKYYNVSPYVYCHNNPTNRIDNEGKWDIKVYASEDREKHPCATLIVSDRNGNNYYRTVVRTKGTGGRDRSQTNADTPTGEYQILEWRSTGNTRYPSLSYGQNDILALQYDGGPEETKGTLTVYNS